MRLGTIAVSSVLAVAATLGVIAASGAAQADPIRIVAFGDSWTVGRYLQSQDAYPAQLEAALRAKGYDVTVQNAGSNGDTTITALERADAAVPAGTTIAIVEFGINDERSFNRPPTKDNLETLVRRLQGRGVQVLLVGARGLDFSDVAAREGAAYEQWPMLARDEIGRDGHHPNAEGYKLFVAHMLPTVEKMIARVTAGR